MTDFGKFKSHAFKSAVIALVLGDAATYIVVNRQIVAPVASSENLADLIDSPDQARASSSGLAGIDRTMPDPTVALVTQTASTSVSAVLEVAPVPALPVPVIEEAKLDEPDLAKASATEISARRGGGATSARTAPRAQAKAFSRAFAHYPVAGRTAIAVACDGTLATTAEGANCGSKLQQQTVENVALEQSAASAEAGLVTAAQAPELPALLDGSSPPVADQPATIPASQGFNKEAEKNPTAADAASRSELPGQNTVTPPAELPPLVVSDAAERLAHTADAAARTPMADEFVTRPVAFEAFALRETTHVAEAARRSQQSFATHGVTVSPRERSSITEKRSGNKGPTDRPRIETHRNGRLPTGSAQATASDLAAVDAAAVMIVGDSSDCVICLRDMIAALQPLMSNAEFDWLMHSKSSATMVNYATLQAAGIDIELFQGSGKLKSA